MKSLQQLYKISYMKADMKPIMYKIKSLQALLLDSRKDSIIHKTLPNTFSEHYFYPDVHFRRNSPSHDTYFSPQLPAIPNREGAPIPASYGMEGKPRL